MNRFFGAIKKFFAKNYWLQPVLLVAVVFILVFSIQGITTLVNNISDTLSGKDKCNTCTDVSYADVEAKIEDATDEIPVFVLITTDECASCVDVYTRLDRYIRKFPQYQVFRIEIQENSEESEADNVVYDDTTLTKEKYEALRMNIFDWLKNPENDVDSDDRPTGEFSSFSINTPTLIKYGSNGEILDINAKITTTSSSGVDKTYENIAEFFNGAGYPATVAAFPWWAWGLCIAGGAGAIFAVILLIRKRKN